MILARVIGEVVASQKHASHQGRKLLLIEPEAVGGTRPAATPAAGIIALDAVDAGLGDRVLVVLEGFSAMTAVGRPQSPIDAAVVGIVERLDLIARVPGLGHQNDLTTET